MPTPGPADPDPSQRPNGPNGTSRLWRRVDDDRGATLALVAISLMWIVGMAALVIDLGGGWSSRQNLIAASDAAALSVAQDMVDRPWDQTGACWTAQSYVAENAPEATQVACDIDLIGADGGQVTVTVSESLDTSFLQVDGGDPDVGSTSTVAWGPPATVSALRPLALCYDGSAALKDLIDNPPSWSTWVRIDFVRDDPTACGGVAGDIIGNFATVDFEGGASSTEIRNWMRDGYPGQVAFDPPTTTGCASPAVCYERPYASNAIAPELYRIRSLGSHVLFPVYDYIDADEAHLIGMVRARLYYYWLYGEPENWSIELKVEPGLVAGTCCGPPDLLFGTKVIAICGVDPGASDTCGASAG